MTRHVAYRDDSRRRSFPSPRATRLAPLAIDLLLYASLGYLLLAAPVDVVHGGLQDDVAADPGERIENLHSRPLFVSALASDQPLCSRIHKVLGARPSSLAHAFMFFVFPSCVSIFGLDEFSDCCLR